MRHVVKTSSKAVQQKWIKNQTLLHSRYPYLVKNIFLNSICPSHAKTKKQRQIYQSHQMKTLEIARQHHRSSSPIQTIQIAPKILEIARKQRHPKWHPNPGIARKQRDPKSTKPIASKP